MHIYTLLSDVPVIYNGCKPYDPEQKIFYTDHTKDVYVLMARIALYQPDIPQNAGATMRLCACLSMGLDIIEPCGFLLDDRKIKRSAMDYAGSLGLIRHQSWNKFLECYQNKHRIVLLTTKSNQSYVDFAFKANDILLAGQESAGVPDDVHNIVDECITIPMPGGGRSLNVVNSLAMVAGEALRQTGGFK